MVNGASETEDMAETDDALDPARSGGGAGGFLKRLFLALLKVGLVLLILAGLAFGAWLIFLELDRSFDSVIARSDRNTRRIEQIEAETEAQIAALEEQNYESRVRASDLEAALATREVEIATLEETLGAELEQQEEMLAEAEEQIVALVTEADTLGQESAALSAGLLALQDDLNNEGQQIDQLGGEVDGLSETLAALDTRAADLQSQVDTLADEDLAGWRRAVALFRIWEMIGRARLRLVDGNLGLAAADVELALAALDDLVESDSEQASETFTALRERLLLATANLPDQPLVAGRDLETAWETLDVLIAGSIAVPAAEGDNSE